jgi:hypothetical protein
MKSISVYVQRVQSCGRKRIVHGRGKIVLVVIVSHRRMSLTVTPRTDGKRTAHVALTLVTVTEIRGGQVSTPVFHRPVLLFIFVNLLKCLYLRTEISDLKYLYSFFERSVSKFTIESLRYLCLLHNAFF